MRVVRFVVLFSLVMVLCFGGVVRAQEPVENQPVTDKPAVVAFSSRDEVTQTDGAFASVRGTVRRADGGETRAILTLVNVRTGQYFVEAIRENGTFLFNHLPVGEYGLFAQGMDYHFFPTVRRQTLNAGQNWRAEIVLENEAPFITRNVRIESPVRPFLLLRNSDAVVYGKIEKIEELDSTVDPDSDGGPDIRYVTCELTIRTRRVVKGTSMPKKFSVRHEFVQGKADQPTLGDEVLLFLEQFGAKEWVISNLTKPGSKDGISKRMKEFVALTRHRTPDREIFAEWLVQGVVEPESRFPASEELLAEFPVPEDFDERSGDDFRRQEKNERDPFRLSQGGDDFLTQGQKERLVRALFETQTVGNLDLAFVAIVLRFGHPDTPAYLAEQLRQQADKPSEVTSCLLAYLAESSADTRLKRFSQLTGRIEGLRDAGRSGPAEGYDLTEQEKNFLTARDSAWFELQALIRAALWAYDHPEAQ
jgi:hypothetical protein